MSLLDDVMIAAPCNLAWDEMPGDDRVRHCTGCSKNVYNISAMTKSEAERFLEQNGTTECMRLYRRVDGTIITDNCPVGLRKLRDRARKILRFTAAVISNLIAVSCAFAHEEAPRSLSAAGEGHQVPTNPWPNKVEVEVYDGFSAMRPHSSNARPPRKGTTIVGSECSSAGSGNNQAAETNPPRMFLGKPSRPAATFSTFGIPASMPRNNSTAGGIQGAAAAYNNTGSSAAPAADTTAHTHFVNAQTEEFRGNYILALPLYNDALRAAKGNTSSDPEFVKMLEGCLVRVRARLQNPGNSSVQEELNSNPIKVDQK